MSNRLLIPVLALMLLAAACSDDGASPDLPASSSTTLAPTTTIPPTTTTGPPTPPPTPAPVSTSTSSPTTTTTTTLPPLQGLALEVVGEGYATPVFVAAPPGDPRLFVVEKPGRIRVIGGAAEDDVFLDIRSLTDEDNLEQGLLGMAFHPSFADNGRLFVHYTDRSGTSTVAEYQVSADDPDRADPDSGRIVLTQSQPRGNHNGGMLAFGPDGYLFVSLGDGGGADDGFGNGQRADTLLGTLLRIDVDGGDPYAIPPGNPFVAGGGAPEVWAFGLRNPWRFSIDDGLLYIGDVGQRDWEEVDVAPVDTAGLNYGWSVLEGEACFRTAGCDTTGFTMPVVVYPHSDGCSVTGGYVYRGAAIPEMDGQYFYGDWCGGWVRSFRYSAGTATDHTDWTDSFGRLGQIVSFGLDGFGELHVVVQDGTIHKIVPVR